MAWNSNVDLRASVEFPLLMQLMGARFRFGVEVGSFKFENAKFNEDNPAIQIGETFSGITAMGILSFPAGPGKIKIGLGLVGSSPGFSMEASYGLRIGEMLEIRGGEIGRRKERPPKGLRPRGQGPQGPLTPAM